MNKLLQVLREILDHSSLRSSSGPIDAYVRRWAEAALQAATTPYRTDLAEQIRTEAHKSGQVIIEDDADVVMYRGQPCVRALVAVDPYRLGLTNLREGDPVGVDFGDGVVEPCFFEMHLGDNTVLVSRSVEHEGGVQEAGLMAIESDALRQLTETYYVSRMGSLEDHSLRSIWRGCADGLHELANGYTPFFEWKGDNALATASVILGDVVRYDVDVNAHQVD